MMAQGLEAAFRATTYRVDTAAGVFDLRIGLANRAFDAFLRRQKVSRWGVLTACNPGAVRDDENARRQQRLRERLCELGRPFLPACNIADDGAWPAEPGCLLLQANEEEMRGLAGEFSQLAFICGNIGGVPRLVYVDAAERVGRMREESSGSRRQ
jgi:hypothetical protein